MARVTESKKSCTVNPLKMSQPLGASYAYLGMNRCMPVMHGSQGCTAFGLVLMVRHFREAIPLQTTAMNEATTVLGGSDNIEKAILNIKQRANPQLIGICSTGLTETKGEDVMGDLKLIRSRHPELGDTRVVYCSTPDYVGAFQDGWVAAVLAMIQTLVEGPAPVRIDNQVNVLAGSHLTVADLEELREMIEAFGLYPVLLPDVSGSLDGHVPEEFSPATLGGTTLQQVSALSASVLTLAVGEQMRGCAIELEMRTGVGYEVFDRLTGLEASDRLLATLSRLSGQPVPLRYRRQRSQLVDAMLDGHFFFCGKKVAIGAEPDVLWSMASWLHEMGCEIAAAVTTTKSPLLADVPAEEVLLGDLEDLEARAAGCDLLLTHSHGRQMAERLAIPLLRIGLPMFDRLGAMHRLSIGYRGTRDLVFEVGNLFMASGHPARPDSWPLPESSRVQDSACAT